MPWDTLGTFASASAFRDSSSESKKGKLHRTTVLSKDPFLRLFPDQVFCVVASASWRLEMTKVGIKIKFPRIWHDAHKVIVH